MTTPLNPCFSGRGLAQVAVLTGLAISLVCGGCQHQAASKLTGRWDMTVPGIGENSRPENDESSETVADQTQALVDGIANGDESTGRMSLVFHRNGKLETYTDFPMASTGKPKVGTWSFKTWDEKHQKIVIACDLFDEHVETEIRFIDDDTIELVPPNIAVLKMKLRFRRSNQ